MKLRSNFNSKNFGINVALWINCDSNYVDRRKIISAIDGQPIGLTGKNKNSVLKTFQMNLLYKDTTIITTRII